MPKFEKKFVYFIWDDSLLGKKVFYSNSIDTLQEYVEKNSKDSYEVVTQQGYSDAPFWIDGTGSNGNCSWIFAYYDPNYETKLAYEQGKTIQYYDVLCNKWVDTLIPAWSKGTEYRAKPEETYEGSFVTKRELAIWLAKGNGEWNLIAAKDVDSCLSQYPYSTDESDSFISTLIVIRKWEDTEWVRPTREYMGLD